MYRCKTNFRAMNGRWYYVGGEIDYSQYARLTFLEQKHFEKVIPPTSSWKPSESIISDSTWNIGTDPYKQDSPSIPDTPTYDPPTEFGGGDFGGGGASGDF